VSGLLLGVDVGTSSTKDARARVGLIVWDVRETLSSLRLDREKEGTNVYASCETLDTNLRLREQ
jgi:hypothetical protein